MESERKDSSGAPLLERGGKRAASLLGGKRGKRERSVVFRHVLRLVLSGGKEELPGNGAGGKKKLFMG